MDALRAQPDVIEDEEHENFVTEDELATSTVNLKVFFWVDTKDFRRMALITKGNVVRAVKEALEDHGYYMPADIQEIKLYGGEKDFPFRMVKDVAEEKSIKAKTTRENSKKTHKSNNTGQNGSRIKGLFFRKTQILFYKLETAIVDSRL